MSSKTSSAARGSAADGDSGAEQYSGQCSIYRLIDGLDDTVDLPDLIKRLKKILNKVAYAVVTSESAANESHEKWHTVFTNRLHQAAGKERKEAAAKQPANGGSSASARMPKRQPPSNLTPALQQILKGTHATLHEDDGDGDDDDDGEDLDD